MKRTPGKSKHSRRLHNPGMSLVLLFLFLIVPVMLLTVSSCKTQAGIYTMENNGQTVTLARGDTLTLKLESNPTTGYGWQLTEDMDGSVASLEKTEYRQSEKAEEMVGSGGYEYFYFRAGSPGSTYIVLNYARPWEEGVEPIDVFKLSVVVE